MIPVARWLSGMNHKIIIGCGPEHMELFRKELPGLSYIDFKGFRPLYSKFLPQYLVLLIETPLLIYHSVLEHFRLKSIIRRNSVDIVISDNRFGLWNSKITTAYFTHMPLIPFPAPFRFLEFIGIYLHRAVIKRYSYCYIPDLPGDINLTGRLSHGLRLPVNVRFAGILSRFMISGETSGVEAGSDIQNTVILSGPEPQKTIMKTLLLSLLKEMHSPSVILEGRPGLTGEKILSGNITSYSHLPAEEMREVITRSKNIICRSGYTTIMELVSLNRSALLIPTPGQTEQEYLATYLTEKGWFSTVSQNEIMNGLSLSSVKVSFPSGIREQSSMLLDEALRELSEEKHKKEQSKESAQKS
jgi:UDP-N-acetylglucosamine transferase subunit ALG13